MLITVMIMFMSAQLLAALIFSIVGLVGVFRCWLALRHEMLAGGVERLPLEAYQRFVAARMRITLSVGRVNAFTILMSIVVLTFGLDFLASDLNFFIRPFYLTFLLLLAFIIGLFISACVCGVVRAIFIDAKALQLAQISSLRRNEMLIPVMKTMLFKFLPLLLFLEAFLGIMVLGMGYPYLAIFLFMALAALGAVVSIAVSVFAVPFYALTAFLRPIEQTQWADLAPRIAAWARLAGVEIASVQIQQDVAVGAVTARTIGLRRATLVISEALLHYTEWRQRDAMIATVLGLARKHVHRTVFLYRLFVWLVAIALIATVVPLVLFSGVSLPLWLVLIFYLLLMFGALIVYRRSVRAAYFHADRIAAFLTGDPTAVMVVMSTANALNGIPTTLSAQGIPSTSDRMQMLDRLAWQPWLRAPQAAMPVPAITAVSIGQYVLTVPFTTDTSSGPVPPVPYANLV